MPRKKKPVPLTKDMLIEMLDGVLYEDSDGVILAGYREDTELNDFVEEAVKKINEHFGA